MAGRGNFRQDLVHPVAWSPIFLRSQSVPYSGAAMPVNVEAVAT